MMKLWRFRLHMAWRALRGEFDYWQMPRFPDFAVSDEENELFAEIPFVEVTDEKPYVPNEFTVILPESAWRAYN